MRASYAFALQKNNAEVSTYSVLTPTFIIEPKKNSENRRKQGVSCGFRCICRCSICPVRAQL